MDLLSLFDYKYIEREGNDDLCYQALSAWFITIIVLVQACEIFQFIDIDSFVKKQYNGYNRLFKNDNRFTNYFYLV